MQTQAFGVLTLHPYPPGSGASAGPWPDKQTKHLRLHTVHLDRNELENLGKRSWPRWDARCQMTRFQVHRILETKKNWFT